MNSAKGVKKYKGVKYSTDVVYLTGLLPPGNTGVNHSKGTTYVSDATLLLIRLRKTFRPTAGQPFLPSRFYKKLVRCKSVHAQLLVTLVCDDRWQILWGYSLHIVLHQVLFLHM